MFYDKIVSIKDEFTASNKTDIIFRGEADYTWHLESKLMRTIKKLISQNLNFAISYQDLLTEDLNFNSNEPIIEQMARIQHYAAEGSAGTRLLDYTTSMDVALFFACNDKTESDGALYLCPNGRKRDFSNLDIWLMSRIACLKEKIKVTDFVEMILESEPDKYNFNLLRYQSYEGKRELGIRIMSWLDYGFIISPSENEMQHFKDSNVRLFRQKGCFFMTGNKMYPNALSSSTVDLPRAEILPELADIPSSMQYSRIKKIKIPKEEKKGILEILAEKKITKEYLLP